MEDKNIDKYGGLLTALWEVDKQLKLLWIDAINKEIQYDINSIGISNNHIGNPIILPRGMRWFQFTPMKRIIKKAEYEEYKG